MLRKSHKLSQKEVTTVYKYKFPFDKRIPRDLSLKARETQRTEMAQDPLGGGLQPPSGLLASLCTKAGREWMIPEVLCTMLLLL